jgi:hypothetical protein
MKIAKFKPLFIATGLAMGMASQAFASPVFSVDRPPSGGATFNADFINGNSSELLTGNAVAGTLTATSGWLQLSSFSNGGTNVLPGVSGLGVDYQLYVSYNLVVNYAGGAAFGQAGSNYGVSSLNFSVYRNDFNLGDTVTSFTQADASTNTNATFSDTGVADVLLGSGSLIIGTAQLTPLGGAALNATTTYANTAAGDLFFVSPSPFYDLAFNNFNNTSQGIKQVGDCAPNCVISITNANGGVDFNRVPEPATLALLGMGLMGMGISLRKHKAA